MIFTDLIFLTGFLPLAWFVYWPCRQKPWNNLVLLLISLLFYAWGSLSGLCVLLFVLCWNYISAIAINKARRLAGPEQVRRQMLLGVGVNLAVLILYKYLNPALGFLHTLGMDVHPTRLLMPMGLSFYMFSCLSYLLDVYRGKAAVQTSWISLGIYAAFFGRVNMGPIAHYTHMEPQLNNHPITLEIFKKGGPLFFSGLFMKVLLADNLALLFAGLQTNTSWLGTLLFGFAYFFQLYYDFAGYSRMARGLGCFFGFDIPQNFDKPYTAASVQDFWRKWHISLTSWFREYVYIPLGGNRVARIVWLRNLLIVWILTGIWHGSTWNYVIWGLYQALLIALEKFGLNRILKKLPSACGHIWLVVCQLIGWSFFFCPSLQAAFATIGRYFGLGVQSLVDGPALFYLANYAMTLLLAIFFATRLPQKVAGWLEGRLGSAWNAILALGCALLFVLCIACLVSATNQTFLYAAF